MQSKDIRDRINNITISEFDVEFIPNENLKICGLDSLSLAELIFNLETEFNISFSDDELDPAKLITGNDLIFLVESKL